MTHLTNFASVARIQPDAMLRQILEFTNELKARNIKFNKTVYLSLLIAYTRVNAKDEVLSLFDQMAAENFKPSPEFFDKALNFSKRTLDMGLQAEILDRMQQFGVRRTEKTYKVLLEAMCDNYEPERALDTLDYMEEVDKLTPSLAAYRCVIDLCVRSDEPTLAFQLLQKAAKSNEFKVHEEHLSLTVLRCAALNDADSQLASDVVQALDHLGYPYRESHFTLLMEAFASTTDVRKSFLLLNAMRKTGVIPNKKTARAIAHRLGIDKNAIEQAQEVLHGLAAENCLDIAAFNVVIHGLACHGLFDDAMSVYNSAARLGVEPDVETLDSVLDACIHAGEVSTGVQIYNLQRDHGIQPTVSTMSKMVTLICTQDSYEDAFKYLEEMKDMGFIPQRGCYFKLIKRLAYVNDPRLQMAIDDMKACGYETSGHLGTFIENSTEYWNNVPEYARV
ncbi:hypothetical protein DFQ28_010134 [Apophysomyces sp. BC1034]|nr:hypothetical protein DFQ28_010134 [Apophysomyces sp. BC1034]